MKQPEVIIVAEDMKQPGEDVLLCTDNSTAHKTMGTIHCAFSSSFCYVMAEFRKDQR